MFRRIIAALAFLAVLAGCTGGAKPPSPAADPQPAPVQTETPAPAAYDLVIRGATVIDGTGAPGRAADVAVLGDRIAFVGKLGQFTAQKVMEATGLVVAPGFINPHSHTHDFINPFEDYDTTASLMQGITTELGGVDGRSPLPIGKELERIAREGTGVNFGLFVGQGSVRAQVMGESQAAASAAQLEAMKQVVRAAMEQGAFGLSTGLEYRPGLFGSTAEITALAAETKPFGGVYSTHLRSEGNQIVEALKEALTIASGAGVPLNLSHFKIVGYGNWGKEDEVVRLVDEAVARGQKVFADVYPYLAPDYAVNRPLSDWAGSLPPEYMVITRAQNAALVGRTVAEAAGVLNLPVSQAIAALSAPEAGVSVVALVTSEKAMIRFYQAPWSLVSTDGEAQPKLASAAEALGYAFHRRSYGSYPALLGQYVRERKILPLEATVRKMTGAVADSLGIRERGYLKAGQFADILVFDPRTVADRTTWLSPQEYPAGIRYVLVNGVFAVKDGARVEGRPGRVLLHGK